MKTQTTPAETLETAVRPAELTEFVRRVAALSPLARVVVGDTVRHPAGRGCYVTMLDITIEGAEHLLAAKAARDAAWVDYHANAMSDAE
jgi:predicted RNA-binding protein YlxR (DUF448 family)